MEVQNHAPQANQETINKIQNALKEVQQITNIYDLLMRSKQDGFMFSRISEAVQYMMKKQDSLKEALLDIEDQELVLKLTKEFEASLKKDIKNESKN